MIESKNMNHNVSIEADALSEIYLTSYKYDAVGNFEALKLKAIEQI